MISNLCIKEKHIAQFKALYKKCIGLILIALFANCDSFNEKTNDNPPSPPLETIEVILNAQTPYNGNAIQKITFNAENSKRINIPNLQGHSVFFIKVNTSSQTIVHSSTGHAFNTNISTNLREVSDFPSVLNQNANIPRFRDHTLAQKFNANPPNIPVLRKLSRNIQVSPIGIEKFFWVEDVNDNFIQINTTLRAVSEHSAVWVAHESWNDSDTKNENKVNQMQVIAFTEKFDRIYKLITPIFGKENGLNNDGKIHILVYDINPDRHNNETMIVGFFWSKDMMSQSAFDKAGVNIKSNEAEMFYMDSYILNMFPDLTYSTLAHEFQHLINYNENVIKRKQNPSVWYNEMLSMLAEDIISPLIDISENNPAHPISMRIPTFLEDYYLTGVAEWKSDPEFVLASYSNIYAFGAYLARNYGGAELIREIAQNNAIDVNSISNALLKISGVDFKTAISRYGEALIYSGNHKPAGANSFYNTVSQKIDMYEYTFNGFDIWSGRFKEQLKVWNLGWQFTMPAYSIIVQSFDEWQAVNGSLDILVQKPSDPSIDVYIMVR